MRQPLLSSATEQSTKHPIGFLIFSLLPLLSACIDARNDVDLTVAIGPAGLSGTRDLPVIPLRALPGGGLMPCIGFGTAGLGDATERAVALAYQYGYRLFDSAQAREWYMFAPPPLSLSLFLFLSLRVKVTLSPMEPVIAHDCEYVCVLAERH